MATLDRTCKTLDSEQLSVFISDLATLSPQELTDFTLGVLNLLEKITVRKRGTEIARSWLNHRFPNLFCKQPKLFEKSAYGEIKETWENLPENAKEAIPYKAIKRALYEVTHTPEYLQLLTIVGTPRYNANGEVTGKFPILNHAAFAKLTGAKGFSHD